MEQTVNKDGRTERESDDNKILRVEHLKKYFHSGKTAVKAVDDVSLDIYKNETLGVVGESGCGKSTLGRTIAQLYNATDGDVFFEGQNIHDLPRKKLKEIRRDMQVIFQDPFSSLNPRMTVGDIIGEPLDLHKIAKGKERENRIKELLELVGLDEEHMNRYPHEFSGGQCQRIGIARALALEPKFIICDEPVSALDVSVQAQVIKLLKHLQEKMGLTYLLIAHDLSVVKHISDRIAVMYLGKIVEVMDAKVLNTEPLHPYTQALLSAVPEPDVTKDRRERIMLKGDIPSPANPPSGCSFRTRCPMAMEICSKVEPQLREVRPNHYVSCHLFNEEENE